MDAISNYSSRSARLALRNDTVWKLYLSDFALQWSQQPILNYFFAALMGGLGILGTLGNVIVIVSFVVVTDLHHLQYVFVGNLAVADLIITAVVIPVNVIVTIRGPHMFRDHPWLCELDGSICASACAGSIWCIMAISVERYICICHHPFYRKTFTPVGAAVVIVVLWIIAHSIHLPNYLGWGATSYSGDLYLCTAELRVWSYSVFYGVSAILIPIFVSFFAYFQIYLRVRISRAARNAIVPGVRTCSRTVPVSKRAARTKTPHSRATQKSSEALVQEIRIVKALFKVFIIFLVSWLPLGLFFVARSWIPFPKWYSYVGLIVAHGSSATNSIVYFWMTDLVRSVYAGYRKFSCRHRRSRAYASKESGSQSLRMAMSVGKQTGGGRQLEAKEP